MLLILKDIKDILIENVTNFLVLKKIQIDGFFGNRKLVLDSGGFWTSYEEPPKKLGFAVKLRKVCLEDMYKGFESAYFL